MAGLRAMALALAAWFGAAAAWPALAQQHTAAAAEHSVVRVALIMTDGGRPYLHSTGSGFVVAPNLVVTNAHVVAATQQYPTVAATVVTPDGAGPVAAQVVAYSQILDLALLRFNGQSPPPLTLSRAPLEAGDAVIALGYPDVDDLQRTPRDLILPVTPSRSAGDITSLRDMAPTGDRIPTINHEATISSGSSGGPLLDACGRVIGVNTWHARGQYTLQSRGVATRSEQLIEFLNAAGVRAADTAEHCRTAIEQAETARDAAVAALTRQNAELTEKLAEAERLTRVAMMAGIGGGVLFLLSLIALAIAVFGTRRPLRTEDVEAVGEAEPQSAASDPSSVAMRPEEVEAALPAKRRNLAPILWVIAGGVAAAALAIPLAIHLMNGAGARADRLAASFAGRQHCVFDAEASDTFAEDTNFTIDAQSCVNGRTLYAPTADGRALQRILLSPASASIDVLTLT
ncbi:MAG: serine protease, partial [Hyphomonadaceae bacterium]